MLEKAKASNPASTKADQKLKDYLRKATQNLNTARTLKSANPEEARKLIQETMKMLLPGDELYQSAEKLLKELPKTEL